MTSTLRLANVHKLTLVHSRGLYGWLASLPSVCPEGAETAEYRYFALKNCTQERVLVFTVKDIPEENALVRFTPEPVPITFSTLKGVFACTCTIQYVVRSDKITILIESDMFAPKCILMTVDLRVVSSFASVMEFPAANYEKDDMLDFFLWLFDDKALVEFNPNYVKALRLIVSNDDIKVEEIMVSDRPHPDLTSKFSSAA